MKKSVIGKTTQVQVGNNTGIDIPTAVTQQPSRGKKPPVKVTLNRFLYQSTVAVRLDKSIADLVAGKK